ncbi:hypothetical protein TNIN_364811 [Trichonephila inaurata madagascariensis]|uniref:Uncharacterized protein n=1 Tax=Trichonephila inaurata madagascariensis TaxID=2747483 RepID=A0A8X7CIG0_9ARAC|nr:hypothetical protein TNIN_364811 [Trichonephila inaurata madagascariensis]
MSAIQVKRVYSDRTVHGQSGRRWDTHRTMRARSRKDDAHATRRREEAVMRASFPPFNDARGHQEVMSLLLSKRMVSHGWA